LGLSSGEYSQNQREGGGGVDHKGENRKKFGDRNRGRERALSRAWEENAFERKKPQGGGGERCERGNDKALLRKKNSDK